MVYFNHFLKSWAKVYTVQLPRRRVDEEVGVYSIVAMYSMSRMAAVV